MTTNLNIDELTSQGPLPSLVHRDWFVGWVYAIDYTHSSVMTNDLWKSRVGGVPMNCFLTAATFDPTAYSQVPVPEQEVILLRVIDSAALPQDDDVVRTKIDFYQSRQDVFEDGTESGLDDLTQNQLQFGGLRCRVLGTFYLQDGPLTLGSDLESFASASSLNVYKPVGLALSTIVNYFDPQRLAAARDQAKGMGVEAITSPFNVGVVRYTSTRRLSEAPPNEPVKVAVQPIDFLARRTAVFGMTRTGKSNTNKQLVRVVKRVADEAEVNIGQVIFDWNGEYANPNEQDEGAIANVYPDDTVLYRLLPTEGFEPLLNNFYVQLEEGFQVIREVLRAQGGTQADDVNQFLNTTFDQPDRAEDPGEYRRWQVKVAAYRSMLYLAGYEPPERLTVQFEANQAVRQAVNTAGDETFRNPATGLDLPAAARWFLAARQADGQNRQLRSASSNKPWMNDDTRAIVNMMARRNTSDSFIRGYTVLVSARDYHDPSRTNEVGDEIYSRLSDGDIVILDLSVGPAFIRESTSLRIAEVIFNRSMRTFVKGANPPNIVIYVEEAHNLLGKGLDITDTWPRIAKEGAKFRIGLVYATQEVSSIHPNILANTENWFVSHLNNEREVRELARFYDFDDFTDSLLRAQDVGFARVKTLSSPFVVPVQINKFVPQVAVEADTEE